MGEIIKKRIERYIMFSLLFAALALITGTSLLTASFIVDPTGEIHGSVLIAYATTLLFTASIIITVCWCEHKHKVILKDSQSE